MASLDQVVGSSMSRLREAETLDLLYCVVKENRARPGSTGTETQVRHRTIYD